MPRVERVTGAERDVPIDLMSEYAAVRVPPNSDRYEIPVSVKANRKLASQTANGNGRQSEYRKPSYPSLGFRIVISIHPKAGILSKPTRMMYELGAARYVASILKSNAQPKGRGFAASLLRLLLEVLGL